jgi:hypothetical protein
MNKNIATFSSGVNCRIILFEKGGDQKALFFKGGRAKRGGILDSRGKEEDIRQQYGVAPALQGRRGRRGTTT